MNNARKVAPPDDGVPSADEIRRACADALRPPAPPPPDPRTADLCVFMRDQAVEALAVYVQEWNPAPLRRRVRCDVLAREVDFVCECRFECINTNPHFTLRFLSMAVCREVQDAVMFTPPKELVREFKEAGWTDVDWRTPGEFVLRSRTTWMQEPEEEMPWPAAGVFPSVVAVTTSHSVASTRYMDQALRNNEEICRLAKAAVSHLLIRLGQAQIDDFTLDVHSPAFTRKVMCQVTRVPVAEEGALCFVVTMRTTPHYVDCYKDVHWPKFKEWCASKGWRVTRDGTSWTLMMLPDDNE